MSVTQELSIFESTFAQSDKTDAILVVGEKKLHVNKALLSYHSTYFNTLFNGEFKEKSMPEIPIEDVKLEDFAALLSFIQENPITPKAPQAEVLLQLADRFLLAAAKRHVEMLIAMTPKINLITKLQLADKYNSDVLLKNTLAKLKTKRDFAAVYKTTVGFSDKTKARIYDAYFSKFL
ncbi:hypothetical protein CRE_19783 [Caenorhabditis remanei]|uniref:BTB domain-containing protein n=1 Tax=Caenorhabditis remanei TaxID=31234 RepID=E3MTA4_CAERE|nr:hypothetical protein CRE_19783 [Caenorhabditis remanei]